MVQVMEEQALEEEFLWILQTTRLTQKVLVSIFINPDMLKCKLTVITS
jgi:hypothetical protein